MTEKEKQEMDEVLKRYRDSEWAPQSCLQEFYHDCFQHISFCHKGHEYFIYENYELEDKPWTIFDRDLNDPKYAYNVMWEKEPRFDFADISELAFSFVLRNDGRTIAQYICDFNNIERLLVPEPVDKNEVNRKW